MADQPSTVPGNLRPLVLVERICASDTPVTATDIMAEMELPKPTAHRLLATLEAEGFIRRHPDGRGYISGLRMQRLAAGMVATMRRRAPVSMVLRDLSEKIGETCNIAQRDGDAVVYIDRVETKWPLQIALPVGTRVPLHCSAAGKVWLASLSDAELEPLLHCAALERRAPNTITDPARLIEELRATRARGWGEDNEEAIEGMVALAVPVEDAQGRLYATLSFHAPALRMSLERARGHVALMRQTATEISRLFLSEDDQSPQAARQD